MIFKTPQQLITVEEIKNATVELGEVTVDLDYTNIDLLLENGDRLLLSCGDEAVIVDGFRVHMEKNHYLCGYVFEGTKEECQEVADFLNRVIAQCIYQAKNGGEGEQSQADHESEYSGHWQSYSESTSYGRGNW